MLQYFLHVSSFRCNALQFTRRWNRNYNLLIAYGKREGTYNVPQKWKQILPTGEVVNLGKWLNTQRNIRTTTLTQERKDKLQALVDTGMLLWNMKNLPRQEIWDRNYELLLAYGEQEGTYNVPKRWKQILPTGEVVKLGKWLCFQRHVRDTTLTHERKDKLQVLVDTGRLLWNMNVLKDENEV